MKITPKKGYLIVSHQEIVKEKKAGNMILVGEEKRLYFRVESDGEIYKTGQLVFAEPFKTKFPVGDNKFLIAEEDIIASFTLEEAESQ